MSESFEQTHLIEVHGTIKVFNDETPEKVLQRLGSTGLWIEDYEVMPTGAAQQQETQQ